MRFTLRNNGYPWHSIYKGRKEVGRVYQHVETKRWHAHIGHDKGEGATPSEAFRNVAAKGLGFETPAQLQVHNTKQRRRKDLVRQVADLATNEAINNRNFEPFEKMLRHPVGVEALVGAFTRHLGMAPKGARSKRRK